MALRTTITALSRSASRAWAERTALLASAGERLLAGIVLGFALWTLCCHLTVATRGTGFQLWWTFGLTLLLLAGGLCWRARRMRAAGDAAATSPAEIAAPLAPASRPISVVGLFGAFIVIGLWNRRGDPFYFWADALAFLLLGGAWLLWKPVPLEPAPGAGRGEPYAQLALWLLALLAAALTAMMRRPNSDDVLYVNIAAELADHPEYVLYARDTLHGDGPPQLAAYAAHSYELLAGTLCALTGIPALQIMHLAFAPIAGALTVLALGQLFRLIEPRRWPWLVAIVVSWYLFDGTTDRSITGHAFPRIFQGKAVLLSVAVPLIAAYAMAFALQPSWRRWRLLAAGVISGIGLSSTGIWLALLVGFTGLFVPLRFERAFAKTLGWGLCALLYPVAFALVMRATLLSAVEGAGPSTPWQIPTTIDLAGREAQGLRPELNSFGGPLLAHAYLAMIVLAWPLARSALARRYLVAFSLGGFAVLMNPFLTGLIAANVTGVPAYSRALWYMPFAAAFAISFAAPLPASRGRWRIALGALVTATALYLFYRDYPKRSTFELLEFPPALKVDADAYRAARALTRALHDDQARALVPSQVALVVPMLQHGPLLVISKPRFFDDGGARYRMMVSVERTIHALRGRYRRVFIDRLAYYDVRGVVTTEAAMQTDGMAQTLETAGYREQRVVAGYHVWIRKPWTAAERGFQ